VSDAAPPASAAAGSAQRARSRLRALTLRWPAWLPKTVVVTAALTLLTAWVLPALSHQWQDRQRARELTAGLVSEIGKNTSHALVTSSFLTYNRFASSTDPSRPGFNQEVYNQLDLEWRTSSAEVEAQLQAYFPDSVVERWRAYRTLVWGTYRLITDNTSTRPRTLRTLRRVLGGEIQEKHFAAMATPWWNKRGPDSRKARAAYFYVSTALLKRRSLVIDEILDSHPAGFSTRPRDLLRDLLPVP
jgi:hypothetical protein